MSIYLDYMASTPVHPDVIKTMLQHMGADGDFANPSALHALGIEARAIIGEATQNFAKCLGTEGKNIIWTSGATEANNWAIHGIAQQYGRQGKHIITATTEHKAILEPCEQLENQGFSISKLKPQKNGIIDLEELKAAIRPDTILISIMAVNNETGVIQPITEIAKIAKENGIIVHTDAVQAVGKIEINLSAWGVDLASFSAHKTYGPKGIGALYIAPNIHLPPIFFGGGQQKNLRPGTLATQQIVGMCKACEIMTADLNKNNKTVTKFRDKLWTKLKDLPGLSSNIDFSCTIPHVLNFHCSSIDSGALMYALRDLAITSGSACNAATNTASHVLIGMGIAEDLAGRSIRLGLSPFMREKEIDIVAEKFCIEVNRLNAIRVKQD